MDSSFEYIQGKQFSNCCHKGKVSLPENSPYPYKLENLSTGLSKDSINFRKNMLAFASLELILKVCLVLDRK